MTKEWTRFSAKVDLYVTVEGTGPVARDALSVVLQDLADGKNLDAEDFSVGVKDPRLYGYPDAKQEEYPVDIVDVDTYEDNVSEAWHPTTGERVHVNRDDEQWGRIAAGGVVTQVNPDGTYIVAIGGTIMANVLCGRSDLSRRDDT